MPKRVRSWRPTYSLSYILTYLFPHHGIYQHSQLTAHSTPHSNHHRNLSQHRCFRCMHAAIHNNIKTSHQCCGGHSSFSISVGLCVAGLLLLAAISIDGKADVGGKLPCITLHRICTTIATVFIPRILSQLSV